MIWKETLKTGYSMAQQYQCLRVPSCLHSYVFSQTMQIDDIILKIINTLCMILVVFIVLCLAIAIVSCKSPKDILRTDTIAISDTHFKHDSVFAYRHDSTSTTYKPGQWRIDSIPNFDYTENMPAISHTLYLTRIDTVFLYRERRQRKEQVRTDTIIKYRDHTTYVDKVKEVNHLYWWQSALMYIGGFCFLGLAAKAVIKRIQIM